MSDLKSPTVMFDMMKTHEYHELTNDFKIELLENALKKDFICIDCNRLNTVSVTQRSAKCAFCEQENSPI